MQIAIFARAPVAGACKTRLIPALGAEGAAQLHAQLVERSLATAMSLPDAEVTLWTAGNPTDPFFLKQQMRWSRLCLKPQSDGDLGQRMHEAFMATNAPMLLMGSDCPALTTEHLLACHRALSERDAVFLPAEDGGYVLVGLNPPCVDVFRGIDWSTDQVMAQTRGRLREKGLSWSEPVCLWDVDRPEDLVRLAELDIR
ncbi:glycosyltransferase [Nitrincola tibetensis]|uniref:Glycosyltransferase n=1 Tax=Nitrincola tibetensis TaxID=2219697 RepID=A0A364NPB9_9GAMM|nr:TIGR04282 family arsenosugar biosynthesis glycosyltransferase [Nitrincola tibetensis]RAU18933.1 glycosyltransferase [Nitrincola tibetensis]